MSLTLFYLFSYKFIKQEKLTYPITENKYEKEGEEDGGGGDDDRFRLPEFGCQFSPPCHSLEKGNP